MKKLEAVELRYAQIAGSGKIAVIVVYISDRYGKFAEDVYCSGLVCQRIARSGSQNGMRLVVADVCYVTVQISPSFWKSV
jgi:hypothetical protein